LISLGAIASIKSRCYAIVTTSQALNWLPGTGTKPGLSPRRVWWRGSGRKSRDDR